jgi:hypothetical protein
MATSLDNEILSIGPFAATTPLQNRFNEGKYEITECHSGNPFKKYRTGRLSPLTEPGSITRLMNNRIGRAVSRVQTQLDHIQ